MKSIITSDGWLESAERVPSENFFELPEREISLLVIHCISLPPGQFGGPYIDQLFTNKINPSEHPYFAQIHQLKVASHLLIDRKGHIKQYVPFDKCARHAGESFFMGKNQCNEFSIGIELEGTEDTPFTGEQYETLAQVTKELMAKWPEITLDRIVGHSDIAPGRKTDPGPLFDWHRYKSSLRPTNNK